jgi:hypothetical protein
LSEFECADGALLFFKRKICIQYEYTLKKSETKGINFSGIKIILLGINSEQRYTFYKNLFLWIHSSDFDALFFVGSEKD